jgi:hypothetical protein
VTGRSFDVAFRRWATRIRARALLRGALTGAVLALPLAALVVLLLWWFRLGEQRPLAFLVVPLGAVLGGLRAVLRGFSDQDVALYLDARLGAHELVSTALSFEGRELGEIESVVVERAERALTEANEASRRSTLKLRVFRASQLSLLVGAAAVGYVCWIELPPAPKPPPGAVGTRQLRVPNLAELDKIIALENVDAHDAAQRARLKAIASRARALREKLRQGMEQREALSELGKLEEDIASERTRFNDREQRAGLEAAIVALEKRPELRPSARALGNGDLTEFDRSMQELANRVEQGDREAAKRALEEAAKAAREKGAKRLAEMLEEQQRLLDERSGRAQAMREFGKEMEKHLGKQAQQDLKDFDGMGNPDTARKVGRALADALKGLSDEERKQLAKRLAEMVKRDQGGNPVTPADKELEEYAKRLATPEGQKELEQQLRDLARQSSAAAEREKALEEAERGLGEGRKKLGVPIPMPGGQNGTGQKPGGGQEDPSGSKQPGSGGPSQGGGHVEHQGQTQKVDGSELRAKAEARLAPGIPLHAAEEGRAPAAAGETANQKGVGALESARETEVGAVDESNVPEEYREQVGRYFEP